jgi:ABC-type nitrate/sulfonate/bicarbonate transport system substrate-binding protein
LIPLISSPSSQAQAEGFFAEQGLTVCYNQVLSSPAQFAALYAGTYNIISTTTGKHTCMASPCLHVT